MLEVSVILPVYDAERTLGACLDAVERQDLGRERYEILVVDNNSTDASTAIARRHPSVRLLAEPRQGAYAARNRGLCEARGRLLAFTDPDCVPRPDWLRRLTAAMADPAAQIVMGRDRPAGSSRAVRLLGEYDHCKESYVMASADAAIYYGHTNNLLARRELFDDAGPFDERARGSDVIFVQRAIAEHGTQAVRYVPDAVVDHLEIRSASVYFRKSFIYGLSAARYASIVAARPLRSAERLRVFRRTVGAAALSRGESAQLFLLLAVGVVAFELGRWSGAAVSARGPWGGVPRRATS